MSKRWVTNDFKIQIINLPCFYWNGNFARGLLSDFYGVKGCRVPLKLNYQRLEYKNKGDCLNCPWV
jgi:hypothetical protein